MGLLDFLKGKKKEEPKESNREEEPQLCAMCGQEIAPGEGKYYGGQWWHKKCLRKARKMARSLI